MVVTVWIQIHKFDIFLIIVIWKHLKLRSWILVFDFYDRPKLNQAPLQQRINSDIVFNGVLFAAVIILKMF